LPVNLTGNKDILEIEMKILGFKVHGFHFRSRHQKKVTSKLDRIANAALLDAAVKNLEVLAQIINKYGKIQILHDDTIVTEAENIRVKLYKEAAQTILNNRRQELVSHVGEIIDRVMGLNNVPDGLQHEERSFEGVTPGEHNSTKDTVHQRRSMQRSLKSGSDSSELIKGLAILAALEEIVNQQRTKQTKDSVEE